MENQYVKQYVEIELDGVNTVKRIPFEVKFGDRQPIREWFQNLGYQVGKVIFM